MNKPFKFKQFSLDQDRCAMKVGTDGVLLGAWAAIHHQPKSILDIGAGTGLVALMLAQRSTAETIEALLKIAKSYAERGKEAQANAGPLGETVANVLEITMKLIDAAEITRRGREVKIASSVEFKAFAVNAINSAVTSAQLAAKRVQSANNMKQMGLAFHNYTDINKSFPPAVIVGPKGHKHSWRVAMLPYIDQKDLYDQYRFDEPWDSKNNLKVLAQMPAAYRHPDDAADSTNTAYFALVGPDTIFGAEEPISFAQVTDGTSNTIMYIEAKRAVPWTKPEDIPYDPDAEIPALGGYFPEGFNATFADGSVRFIAKDFDPELLRRMIQMSDGKPVNE